MISELYIFLVCMIIATSAGILAFLAGRHLPPLLFLQLFHQVTVSIEVPISKSHRHVCEQPLPAHTIKSDLANTIEPFSDPPFLQ